MGDRNLEIRVEEAEKACIRYEKEIEDLKRDNKFLRERCNELIGENEKQDKTIDNLRKTIEYMAKLL